MLCAGKLRTWTSCLFLLTAFSSSLVFAAEFGVDYGWGLPVTIEVLQDVRAQKSNKPAVDRGTLHSSASFSISKGDRFEMTEVHQEGVRFFLKKKSTT